LVLAAIVIHQFFTREFDLHLTAHQIFRFVSLIASKNPQNTGNSFAGPGPPLPLLGVATELLANDFPAPGQPLSRWFLQRGSAMVRSRVRAFARGVLEAVSVASCFQLSARSYRCRHFPIAQRATS